MKTRQLWSRLVSSFSSLFSVALDELVVGDEDSIAGNHLNITLGLFLHESKIEIVGIPRNFVMNFKFALIVRCGFEKTVGRLEGTWKTEGIS
jgi:hypothetical protein